MKGLLVGGLVGGVIGALIVGLAASIKGTPFAKELSEIHSMQQLANADEILTPWDLLADPVLTLFVLATHEVGPRLQCRREKAD